VSAELQTKIQTLLIATYNHPSRLWLLEQEAAVALKLAQFKAAASIVRKAIT
jgi:hypothetical protein